MSLESVKEKAREVFGESSYNGWEDVFDELDGECVADEFVEEHRWYSLFQQVYKVDNEYYRVYVQRGTEMFEPEVDPDEVVNVYPQEVTIVKYTTSPN